MQILDNLFHCFSQIPTLFICQIANFALKSPSTAAPFFPFEEANLQYLEALWAKQSMPIAHIWAPTLHAFRKCNSLYASSCSLAAVPLTLPTNSSTIRWVGAANNHRQISLHNRQSRLQVFCLLQALGGLVTPDSLVVAKTTVLTALEGGHDKFTGQQLI